MENNAERRCLIDILSGEMRLDYGWVYFMEREIDWENYERVLRENICVISRRDRCIRRIKVKDNVFVLRGGIRWITPLKKLYRKADDFFSELQCDFDPNELVENLLPHQQKEVELMQAFVSGKKLVILSEMDEFFTEEAIRPFFSLVLKLKERGMDFLIISNNIKVLLSYTSYIYVFFRGRMRHRILKKAFRAEELHSIMIEQTKENEESDLPKPSENPALRFFCVRTYSGEKIDFALHEGEVLNFVDLDITDWNLPARILEGREPLAGGKIILGQEQYRPSSYGSAYGKDIGVIAENSYEMEYFSNDTVFDHIAVVMSLKVNGITGFSKGYLNSLYSELLACGEFTEEELGTPLYMADAATIQKAEYYRWIFYKPKVLICMRPFSSADYKIKKLTRRLIGLAARKGIAVLILSMSIYESFVSGSRVIIMKAGKTHEMTDEEKENVLKISKTE